MTPTDLTSAMLSRPAAASAGSLRLLPWAFVCLGVLAPLVLVVAAAAGSESSLVRAQMIVQGGELLALALMFTALMGLIYALGMHEARRTAASAPGRERITLPDDASLAGGLQY